MFYRIRGKNKFIYLFSTQDVSASVQNSVLFVEGGSNTSKEKVLLPTSFESSAKQRSSTSSELNEEEWNEMEFIPMKKRHIKSKQCIAKFMVPLSNRFSCLERIHPEIESDVKDSSENVIEQKQKE